MEGGIIANITRTGSMWRSASGRSEAFSLSSQEDDDDEALKWAALEKLPTFNRVRKAILRDAAGGGDGREIDIETISLGDKRKLMERLVRVAEEDNEKFLLKLKNRLDR